MCTHRTNERTNECVVLPHSMPNYQSRTASFFDDAFIICFSLDTHFVLLCRVPVNEYFCAFFQWVLTLWWLDLLHFRLYIYSECEYFVYYIYMYLPTYIDLLAMVSAYLRSKLTCWHVKMLLWRMFIENHQKMCLFVFYSLSLFTLLIASIWRSFSDLAHQMRCAKDGLVKKCIYNERFLDMFRLDIRMS